MRLVKASASSPKPRAAIPATVATAPSIFPGDTEEGRQGAQGLPMRFRKLAGCRAHIHGNVLVRWGHALPACTHLPSRP